MAQVTSLEPEGVEMVAARDNLRHIFNGLQHFARPIQAYCGAWFSAASVTPAPFDNSDSGLCGACVELENRGGARMGFAAMRQLTEGG